MSFFADRGDHSDRLDPPPPGSHPKIAAQSAWRLLIYPQTTSSGQQHFLLALLPASFPNVPHAKPVLAWIWYRTRVPARPESGGPVGPTAPNQPTVSTTTAPEPPCGFGDGIVAIDANTGRFLQDAGFG
jgi:hypothetical protein